MKKYFGIVGAGGYGREVMPLAKAQIDAAISRGEAELLFVIEGPIENKEVNNYSLVSLEEFLQLQGEKFFNIAIGDSHVRERIANICIASGAHPFSIHSSNAIILDSNVIGEGVILSPYVTVTSNAKIGKFFHANIYSYVAHDCVIGDFVTFAPSVKCNGNVVIDDHAYIGTGAIIMQGKKSRPITIGKGAIVGMGAVVTKNVPPGATVIGNPARPLTKEGLRK